MDALGWNFELAGAKDKVGVCGSPEICELFIAGV